MRESESEEEKRDRDKEDEEAKQLEQQIQMRCYAIETRKATPSPRFVPFLLDISLLTC